MRRHAHVGYRRARTLGDSCCSRPRW
jgi:hypothetical protein